MLRFGTPSARWVIAATVLGSGVAFLDGTVVNVALPSIQKALHFSGGGLAWIVDGYALMAGGLLLFGGYRGKAKVDLQSLVLRTPPRPDSEWHLRVERNGGSRFFAW